MKSIIERLRVLNDLDIQLLTVRKDLERFPKELAEKSEEPRLLREQAERRKAEVIRFKLDADAVDLELKAGMDALKRLASQMNVLRTSKEFEAVRRQMDAQRAWNSQSEDKELELLSQAEQKQKDVDALAVKVGELDKILAEETLRVNQVLAELKVQHDQLAAQRAVLAKDIPAKELAIYDRIVVNRGQAIAHIEKGFCSACHMKLPPQVQNLTLLGLEMITCASCGRILTAG